MFKALLNDGDQKKLEAFMFNRNKFKEISVL